MQFETCFDVRLVPTIFVPISVFPSTEWASLFFVEILKLYLYAII